MKKRWTCNHQPYYVFLCVLFEHAHKRFGRWRCRQLLGLISIYLAGEDELKKKCSRHDRINHLTSIIVEIERPDDGNVLIAQQISDIC